MVETKTTHDYELILIVTPEAADEVLEAVVNNVSQFITTKGGTIAETQRWGKKKLAYPLKHYLEGNYILMKLQMSPTLSMELENHVRITEQIMRHILVKAGS